MLTDSLPATGIPSDVDLLPLELRRLLEPGHVAAWPSLGVESRRSLLGRLERQQSKRDREQAARDARQQLSAEYVRALCSLPCKASDGYDAAWADFLEKKAAYKAVSRSGSSR